MKAAEWVSLLPESNAQGLQRGFLGRKLSPYFTPLSDGRNRCDLCPRVCQVEKGKRGTCLIRENIDGQYYSLVYGNPCTANVDPIEKKPFVQVLPSTLCVLSATLHETLSGREYDRLTH